MSKSIVTRGLATKSLVTDGMGFGTEPAHAVVVDSIVTAGLATRSTVVGGMGFGRVFAVPPRPPDPVAPLSRAGDVYGPAASTWLPRSDTIDAPGDYVASATMVVEIQLSGEALSLAAQQEQDMLLLGIL